jgi:hypothetical protein
MAPADTLAVGRQDRRVLIGGCKQHTQDKNEGVEKTGQLWGSSNTWILRAASSGSRLGFLPRADLLLEVHSSASVAGRYALRQQLDAMDQP